MSIFRYLSPNKNKNCNVFCSKDNISKARDIKIEQVLFPRTQLCGARHHIDSSIYLGVAVLTQVIFGNTSIGSSSTTRLKRKIWVPRAKIPNICSLGFETAIRTFLGFLWRSWASISSELKNWQPWLYIEPCLIHVRKITPTKPTFKLNWLSLTFLITLQFEYPSVVRSWVWNIPAVYEGYVSNVKIKTWTGFINSQRIDYLF